MRRSQSHTPTEPVGIQTGGEREGVRETAKHANCLAAARWSRAPGKARVLSSLWTKQVLIASPEQTWSRARNSQEA